MSYRTLKPFSVRSRVLDRLMKMIAALDDRIKVTVHVEPGQLEPVFMP